MRIKLNFIMKTKLHFITPSRIDHRRVKTGECVIIIIVHNSRLLRSIIFLTKPSSRALKISFKWSEKKRRNKSPSITRMLPFPRIINYSLRREEKKLQFLGVAICVPHDALIKFQHFPLCPFSAVYFVKMLPMTISS